MALPGQARPLPGNPGDPSLAANPWFGLGLGGGGPQSYQSLLAASQQTGLGLQNFGSAFGMPPQPGTHAPSMPGLQQYLQNLGPYGAMPAGALAQAPGFGGALPGPQQMQAQPFPPFAGAGPAQLALQQQQQQQQQAPQMARDGSSAGAEALRGSGALPHTVGDGQQRPAGPMEQGGAPPHLQPAQQDVQHGEAGGAGLAFAAPRPAAGAMDPAAHRRAVQPGGPFPLGIAPGAHFAQGQLPAGMHGGLPQVPPGQGFSPNITSLASLLGGFLPGQLSQQAMPAPAPAQAPAVTAAMPLTMQQTRSASASQACRAHESNCTHSLSDLVPCTLAVVAAGFVSPATFEFG